MTLADLKGTLDIFVRELFGQEPARAAAGLTAVAGAPELGGSAVLRGDLPLGVPDDHPVHAPYGPNVWPDDTVADFKPAIVLVNDRNQPVGHPDLHVAR